MDFYLESDVAGLQEARDKERKRIVAWLRDYSRRTGFNVMNVELLADMIERGVGQTVAASNE